MKEHELIHVLREAQRNNKKNWTREEKRVWRQVCVDDKKRLPEVQRVRNKSLPSTVSR